MRGRSARPLLVTVLLTVLAIVGIWTLVPVRYQARAEIRIHRMVPHLVFQTEDSGEIPYYEEFVNTQVSVIKSPKVLVRVLERRDVQQTQWYKEARPSLMQWLRGDKIPPLERLRNSLTARPRPKTEIVDVILEDPSAEEARVIVQAVVEEYERYAGSRSDEARDELYGRLSNQYLRLQREVYDWEEICFRLQEEIGTGDPDRLLSDRAIALDEGQAALATIRQEIVKFEMRMAKSGKVDPNAAAVALAGARDANRLSPEQGLDYMRGQLDILREQARVMEQDLAKKQEEYNRLFAKSQELKRETATLQHKRGLFKAVQARKDAKDMEKNIRGRISVLAPATASFTPHNDRRMLYTGIVLVVGLILTSSALRSGRGRADKAAQSR